MDRDQIREYLKSIPQVLPDFDISEWADYVNVIERSVRDPKTGEYKVVKSLYFDVATRLMMARAWHSKQGQQNQFTIKSITGSFAESPNDKRFFVARVELSSPLLGDVVGHATADISESGGKVDKVAPLENAITSAMGRALAFWGFGLIPGGVASLEEWMTAEGRRVSHQQQGEDEEEGEDFAETVRQARLVAVERMVQKARDRFGDEAIDRLNRAYQKIKGVPPTEPMENWDLEVISRLTGALNES